MDTELRESKNYNTDLYNYLCGLAEADIHAAKHQPPLRHPADILADQLANVKAAVLNCKNAAADKSMDRPACVKALFHAVDTFYDNCFNIIKTLCLPSNIREPFAHLWLARNGVTAGKDFHQFANGQHEFVSNITNKIKHDNQKILGVQIKDKKTNNTIEGFYIASIIRDDKLGPDPEIHKHYNNQRTAFSFNYIIKRLIAHILFYDHCLFKAFLRTLRGNRKHIARANPHYKELFDIAYGIRDEFFINEYALCGPEFMDGYRLKFPRILPPKKRPPVFASGYSVSAGADINHRTNTINGYLPYMGNKIE